MFVSPGSRPAAAALSPWRARWRRRKFEAALWSRTSPKSALPCRACGETKAFRGGTSPTSCARLQPRRDDLLAQVFSSRVRAIRWLLDDDDIWTKIETVAAALIDRGELSGFEVEALSATPISSPCGA